MICFAAVVDEAVADEADTEGEDEDMDIGIDHVDNTGQEDLIQQEAKGM